jgi:HEAT repeat protein
LGEIGLPLAKPVLHKALQDHNSIVRDQARYALDRIR